MKLKSEDFFGSIHQEKIILSRRYKLPPPHQEKIILSRRDKSQIHKKLL